MGYWCKAPWLGPNNSFKPTPHRGVNNVLCATLHAVATPLRGGLTQALGPMKKIPTLSPESSLIHALAGSPPEYVVEPRVLVEGDGYIKGCRVTGTHLLSPSDAAQVISVLTDPASYGDRGMGARCFFPGFAFTFGADSSQTKVLVCLECSWVVFYSSGTELSLVPSPAGATALRAIYEALLGPNNSFKPKPLRGSA